MLLNRLTSKKLSLMNNIFDFFNQIKNLIPLNLESGLCIYGSFSTLLHMKLEDHLWVPKDMDIFCNNYNLYKEAKMALDKVANKTEVLTNQHNDNHLKILFHTNWYIGNKLISLKFFEKTIDEAINTSDFTISAIYSDGLNLKAPGSALRDLQTKSLNAINDEWLTHPWAVKRLVLYRYNKYLQRGFIDYENKIKSQFVQLKYI